MLITWGGYAQEPNAQNTSKLKFDKSGYVKYIKFDGKNKTGKWDSPSSPEDFFNSILGAQEQDEFILKNKIEREDGSYYEHYRQFYREVEVEDGLFILHFNNGKLTKANGHYVNTAGVDASPKLTPEEASESYAGSLQIPAATPVKFLHGIVIAEIEEISDTDTTYNTKLCYKIDLLDSLIVARLVTLMPIPERCLKLNEIGMTIRPPELSLPYTAALRLQAPSITITFIT